MGPAGTPDRVRDDLHPRAPRERAALAPVAHGRELGRATCCRGCHPAHACSTSGAVPAPSRSTSPSGWPPARCVGHRRRRRRCSATARTRRPTTRSRPTCASRSPTCTRCRTTTRRSTSCTRTRCSSTSPIRSRRCGRCGASAQPGGRSVPATATTQAMTWYPHVPEHSTAGSTLYRDVARRNRRRARCRPPPAGVGARGRLLDRGAIGVGVVLRHARGPQLVGRALGRPGQAVRVRRPGGRARARRPRRAGTDRGRLAASGRRRTTAGSRCFMARCVACAEALEDDGEQALGLGSGHERRRTRRGRGIDDVLGVVAGAFDTTDPVALGRSFVGAMTRAACTR